MVVRIVERACATRTATALRGVGSRAEKLPCELLSGGEFSDSVNTRKDKRGRKALFSRKLRKLCSLLGVSDEWVHDRTVGLNPCDRKCLAVWGKRFRRYYFWSFGEDGVKMI